MLVFPPPECIYIQEQSFTISILLFSSYLGKLICDQPAVSLIVHSIIHAQFSILICIKIIYLIQIQKKINCCFLYEAQTKNLPQVKNHFKFTKDCVL